MLEDLAPRPLAGLPHEIAEDMESSDVSIFAVRVQTNELKSRMEMTAIVNRRRMRHAHMVNINRQIMLEGMRADFNRVDALSSKVMEIVSSRKGNHRQDCRRLQLHRRAQPRVSLDQDQRHYQPRQMGQSAGRGDFHLAGRGERGVCRRWGGRRLSLRQIRRSPAPAPDHPHAARIASPRSSAKTKRWSRISGRTPTPTKTATAWASLPSAPILN